MAEQASSSVAAVRARQAALLHRHGELTDADHAVVAALRHAYAATVEGVNRLDAISAEIEAAVQNQAALAVDTPMGARAFHKFLLAKQREIISIVTAARELDHANKAALESLRGRYSPDAGSR
ncbi:DUF4226 domain-containing protein [Mycobacterium sp.]|uniref:DUF4226 domain-containing protein n=1 Tax=Mycobacterium sp. TaxID=1785 RepID=UPI00127E4656|nr:DUF4226 domain-containing protein [Mycobacterium sp.]KAA8966473.1 MAG: DUF4226 domain-containing protein [Mycobacterium sp.]